MAAVTVDLVAKSARMAERRGTVRIPTATKVEVMDVYCKTCRRPMSAVTGEPCEMAGLLRGGPIGTRKKRGGVDDNAPAG